MVKSVWITSPLHKAATVYRPTFTRFWLDSLEQAMFALRENRLRTLLSILGVTIGVLSVIVVGTVGKTGRDMVFAEFQTFGLNAMWIYRFWGEQHPFASVPAGSGITTEDVMAIRAGACCPAVSRVSPWVYTNPWEVLIRVGNRYSRIKVDGVDADYFNIVNEEVRYGRLFREDDIRDRKPVVLIGTKVQERFFSTNSNPVGESIRMGDIRLTIIGVLKNKDRQFLSSIGAVAYDVNDRIVIPYSLYQQVLASKDVHTLVAEAKDTSLVQSALQQINSYLTRKHGGKYAYILEDMQTWVETANRYLRIITVIGVVGAGVSLLVGGLGIMNIMATSVVERTREIGIRKAIGARQKDILSQFILEALFISAIGGVLGLALGLVAGVIASSALGISLMPPFSLLIIAVGVASLTGIVSGYYPAKRAAAMRPVDALRYE